jgi:Holliday junction resolvase RusA-like endonuclease
MRGVRLAWEWVGFAVVNLTPPDPKWPKVRAKATWTFREHRRRDTDNLNAWTKAYQDAIAAWLGIDDNSECWRWDDPHVVVNPKGQPGLIIEIYPAE